MEQPASPSREVPGALAWSLVSKVLVSILAIGSNILIVRGLGEHDYGVYSIFLNIARFLSLGIGLGLAQAVLQFLPQMRVAGDARGARQLIVRSFTYQLLGLLIVGAIVYPLRGWLGGLLKADLHTILPLGALLLIFETVWTVLGSVYTALRRMRWLTVASVAQKIVLVALLVVLARGGASVIGVLYVVAGSFVAGILLLAPGLPRILPWAAGHDGAGLPVKRMMNYALAMAVGALVNQLLWRSSDTLVIGYYHTPSDVGFYNAAYNLPQMLLEFVPLAIWPVVLASLAEAHARRPEDLLRGVQLYFRLIFVLVVPVTMTGLVLGGQAYLAMYGAAMAPGAGVAQAFFGVFLLGFFATPLRMALFVKEHALANTLIAAVGAVIKVGLDLALIPRLGIWGGVWGVAVALLLTSFLQYAVTRRRMPGIRIPWGCFLKVMAGACAVLPLWFVRDALRAPLPLAAALIGITVIQYLLLRVLRVYGEEERELIFRSHLPLKRWIAYFVGPPPRRPDTYM